MANLVGLHPGLLMGTFQENMNRVAAHNRAIQSAFSLNVNALLNTPNPLLALGFPYAPPEVQNPVGPSQPIKLSTQKEVKLKKQRVPRRPPAPKRTPLKYLAKLAQHEEREVDPAIFADSLRIMKDRWEDYHHICVPYTGTGSAENWNRVGKKAKARRIQKFMENLKEEDRQRERRQEDKKTSSILTDSESEVVSIITLDDSSDDDVIVLD